MALRKDTVEIEQLLHLPDSLFVARMGISEAELKLLKQTTTHRIGKDYQEKSIFQPYPYKKDNKTKTES